MSSSDPSLSIYYIWKIVCYLLLYVGDIVFIGNSDSFIEEMIELLGSAFHMYDLGFLSYFLGISIISSIWSHFVNDLIFIVELFRQ